MVMPTVDTELTEQFLANTPEPVREHLSASVDLHECLQGFAEGELVAARKVDIG